jgi:hypothetical protein
MISREIASRPLLRRFGRCSSSPRTSGDERRADPQAAATKGDQPVAGEHYLQGTGPGPAVKRSIRCLAHALRNAIYVRVGEADATPARRRLPVGGRLGANALNGELIPATLVRLPWMSVRYSI